MPLAKAGVWQRGGGTPLREGNVSLKEGDVSRMGGKLPLQKGDAPLRAGRARIGMLDRLRQLSDRPPFEPHRSLVQAGTPSPLGGPRSPLPGR